MNTANDVQRGNGVRNDSSAYNLTQKAVNKAVQDVRQRFHEELSGSASHFEIFLNPRFTIK